MTTRLQQTVMRDHAHSQAIGIVDESSFAKKGDKTPGVQRQHCGSTGKLDNCVVTTHLAYATPEGFHTLLSSALFLPEDWSNDRERCRRAGIPEDLVYRPKWRIALELHQEARPTAYAWPGSRPTSFMAVPWNFIWNSHGAANNTCWKCRVTSGAGAASRNCCTRPIMALSGEGSSGRIH